MICKSWLRLVAAVGLAALAVVAVGAGSAGAASPTLPLTAPDRAWRPLEQRWDRGLQAKLDRALRREHLWQTLIGEKKMAVGLVDLTDPALPRFARVNGETMMYAASLPKLAILLAAYQGFEDGSLKETPQVQAELIEMIRRSDNFAASQVVDRVGLAKIERLLLSPRYRFYDQAKGGGLWLGSSFSSDGPQNPEPLQQLKQAATVNQLCRFYYLLAYGRLINPARSRQMLKILAFPDLHDKFVASLENSVPANYLYRKSGEFGICYSDSILVWDKTWRRYILAAMVEHPQGEQILRKLAPVAEQILKPRS